jgi:NADH-quinone oxidoreductase subunit N
MFIIDLLLPETVIIFNILIASIFPLILNKQNTSFLYKPKQSNSLHNFSILCCIIAFLFAYNNVTCSAFFGFHLQNSFLIWCAKLVIIIFVIITLIISLFHKTPKFEIVILMLSGLLGALLMISAGDFIILYLGLELLSLSIYVILASNTKIRSTIEAGIKYLLFSALSSGFIIFGIALIYGFIGTTSLFYDTILGDFNSKGSLHIANILIITGFAFKLGLFPFHAWVTDIYQGAPLYAVTYITLVPKIAYISVLFTLILQYKDTQSFVLLQYLAIFSVIFSSIAALNQTHLLRVLGYSSINNIGICVLPLTICTSDAFVASGLYLIIYLLLNTIIFSIITISPITTIYDIKRLNKYPLIALAFTLTMFSNAGIPPLAGFFGKFLVVSTLFSNSYMFLGVLVLITSAISAFFYVRLISNMFFNLPVLFTKTTKSVFCQPIVFMCSFINLFFPLFISLIIDIPYIVIYTNMIL